jgi:hypothetical protein
MFKKLWLQKGLKTTSGQSSSYGTGLSRGQRMEQRCGWSSKTRGVPWKVFSAIG